MKNGYNAYLSGLLDEINEALNTEPDTNRHSAISIY